MLPTVPISPSGITRIEARSAVTSEGVTIGNVGIAQGFTSGKGLLTFTLVAGRPGLYRLRVFARCPSGEKGIEARVGNGPTLTGMLAANASAPKPADIGLIDLAPGTNTLALGRGWGYYEIAAIELSPAPAQQRLRAIPAIPVDVQATPSARDLLKRVTERYGAATLSGQYDEEECDYVRSVSGFFPAIMGSDLIDYSPSRREHGANPKDRAEQLIRKMQTGGGILTLSWHWNAPTGLIDKNITQPDGTVVDARWYKGFYANATTFDFAAALADPKSDNYRLLLRDIDAIAEQLKKFARADVPILWRPLHEAEGGWFWWGARGAQAYVALWKLMYERLTRFHEIHNLIWVSCSGTKPEWYPGDRYVDIVGIDSYPADTSDPLFGDWSALLANFDGRKPLALTEFGGVPDVASMHRYGVRWAYFVSWTGQLGPRKMGPAATRRLYREVGVVNRG